MVKPPAYAGDAGPIPVSDIGEHYKLIIILFTKDTNRYKFIIDN